MAKSASSAHADAQESSERPSLAEERGLVIETPAPYSTVRPRLRGATPAREPELQPEPVDVAPPPQPEEETEPHWLARLRAFVGTKRVAIAAASSEPAPLASPAPADEADDVSARREFRRMGAPVFSRPAGLRIFSRGTNRVNPTLARFRIFTDDEFARGDRLRLDVYVDGETHRMRAEVAWIEPLPPNAPARFDMGLSVYDIPSASVPQVLAVLRP